MSDESPNRNAIERILEAIANITTTGAFLAMIWLAVFILSDPNGARDINRYLRGIATNLVAPSVEVAVQERDGRLLYEYTVSNGLLGIQPIKHFVLPNPRSDGSTWSEVEGWRKSRMAVFGPQPGTVWSYNRRDGGIERNDVVVFSTLTKTPPVVGKVRAANQIFSTFFYLEPDATTPAGRRIAIPTLVPGRGTGKPVDVLNELRASIDWMVVLEWISVEHGRSLSAAVGDVKDALLAGDKNEALDMLSRTGTLNDLIGDTSETSWEADVLLTQNIRYLNDLLGG